MRITRISAWQVELPLHEGSYKWSGGKSVAVFDSTVVRVQPTPASGSRQNATAISGRAVFHIGGVGLGEGEYVKLMHTSRGGRAGFGRPGSSRCGRW